MTDLSKQYDQDNPPKKRGRPAETFPSGKTVSECADELPSCSTLIARWCLGLKIPEHRKNRFYALTGIDNDEHWQRWLSDRNTDKQLTENQNQ
jgi:hypothetical protein